MHQAPFSTPTAYIKDLENVSPQEVRYAFEKVSLDTVVLIDEIDRLDRETSAKLADTIKTFSDYNVPVRMMMIGVGDSVGELIQGHKSIDRALVQIHMPRMSKDEINSVIHNGLVELSMKIDPLVETKVVALSRGLPHYTHLLMMHAGLNAAENDRIRITDEDFRYSLNESVLEKEQSLKNEYSLAIQSTKKAYMFSPALLACALAERDADGYFAMSDVEKTLSAILGEKVSMASFIKHVGQFCTPERGQVLEKIGKERKFRYRFRDPLMQSFVIMKAMNEKTNSKTPIEQLLLALK